MLLNKLDELNKLRHGIEAQQGQKPVVELFQFHGESAAGQLEQAHRLVGKCIHQPGNPANCPGSHAFHQYIVHANEDSEGALD